LRFLLRKDTAAGLLFVVVGLAFAYAASTYRMGVVSSMGPGYFPFWLGILLTFLGACVFVSGVRAGETAAARLDRWDLKSLVIIVGSIALFGVLLAPLGLIGAIVVIVVASSLASPEFNWGVTILNTAILIALSLAIFVWGIGLPLPLLPAFLAN
jgi:hypothetical protein